MGFQGTVAMKLFIQLLEIFLVMLKNGIAFGIDKKSTITYFSTVLEIAVPLAFIFNKIKRII
jgi:hypothetical protein